MDTNVLYVTGYIDWDLLEEGVLPDGLPNNISLTIEVGEDNQVLDIIDMDL
jgi:hypothetical protein